MFVLLFQYMGENRSVTEQSKIEICWDKQILRHRDNSTVVKNIDEQWNMSLCL